MSANVATGPILTLSKVTKRYGSFVACRDVSLTINPGEVVGLLGQNGAGKSTLMKVLAGIETYETGEIVYANEPLRSGDHAQARALGIAMVHQELSLVGALTVWENIALGLSGRLRRTRTIDRLRELSDRFGLALEAVVDARVASLTVAVRQRIEIAKCLMTEPRVVLLDEPTSILSREEAKRLFQIVRSLAEESAVTVLVSNHRLDEILAVTDRVAVLRGGRLTGEMKTSAASEATLAQEMLGDDFARHAEAVALLGLERLSSVAHATREPLRLDSALDVPLGSEPHPAHRPALEVVDLVLKRPGGSPALDGLSFAVAAGEIVGLVGVEGNGQAELVDVLAGRRRATSGSISVAPNSPFRPRRARTGHRSGNGIGVVPSDRHRHGCVLGMSVAENLFLGRLPEVMRYGLVRRRQMRVEARRLISDYSIQCAGPDAPMWTLSGGHQQRVVLARELVRRPVALVVDQPTRGLDVAAVEAVWTRIRLAARNSIGLLLVSSDLVEVINLCSRVLVIDRGQIKGDLSTETLDVESLGLLIGGVAARESA